MTRSESFRTALGLGAIFLFSIVAGYADCRAPGRDRFIKVFFPGGQAVTAELAVTDEERARGLMFRDKVLPEQGMLFVFEEEDLHSFWMKNTLVPLDMLWLGRDRRIIHIARNVPPCAAEPCPSYGPEIPALFVLELKAGQADVLGLKLQDRLEFVLPSWVR
ncbi:DUF192 domain-containing protein [bacterium]|jgi:uncharacterized membrane protein (UPF0127 family)|nr:MAG: DUF192 domain-containing protein [bacterium]